MSLFIDFNYRRHEMEKLVNQMIHAQQIEQKSLQQQVKEPPRIYKSIDVKIRSRLQKCRGIGCSDAQGT